MPDADHWNTEHRAISQEKIGTGPTARAITLRHPTYPFTADWAPKTGDQLIEIAKTYLEKVKSRLGLPTTSDSLSLTWLPISDDGTNPLALPNSVWITRPHPTQLSQILDQTAILFFVQALNIEGVPKPIGSRLGVRIVAHVAPAAPGAPPKVRITGATRSIELLDEVSVARFTQPDVAFSPFDFFSDVVRDNVRNIVRTAVGLGSVEPAISGLRIRSAGGGEYVCEMYMTAKRQSGPVDTPSEALTLSIRSDQTLDNAVIETFPLFANCADVTARLFVQDPASEEGSFMPHPHCGPHMFEQYRHPVVLRGLTSTDLKDDLDQVSVMQSRLAGRLPTGGGAINEKQPEQADLSNIPHVRTNVFAAASGYQHARNLFDKMRSYGLLPEDYFRRAALPLHVRFRAGVPPGPGKDGKTVNARVDYDPPQDKDFDAALVDADLKPLQVRYALADVQRSGSGREPLGVAADPRMSWHEFGHVLIVAATGALELPFVHSAGDALAAILSDPASKLADPTNSKVAPSWRGATFPWVYLHRRHDRSVYGGWSWSGSFHRQARFSTRSAFLHKGYDSEQILSTTLFRLYRSLGGETFSAPAVRQSAADYTAYLIMRAIAWLGPINWVPAETPDQFVSALIDADIATAAGTPAFPERSGGCAHKVVRWAFEAQGLYATSNPQDVVNAPGDPPEVDIFIADRRAAYKPKFAADPAYAAGGYMPVPLDWEPVPPESPDAPAWHATKQAIQVDGAGDVRVTVGNCGSMGAAGVVVDIWHAAPNADGTAPAWGSGQWQHLGTTPPKVVGPRATEEFGPIAGLPAGRPRFVLAGAACPADLANINVATNLPCAVGPNATPIVDLVAGDNNLGLRKFA